MSTKQPAKERIKCLLCGETRGTRDGILAHLADHTPRALAEELIRTAYPKPTAVKTAPPKPCGKKRWTEKEAMTVLIRAALSRSPNRAEKRRYECDRCGPGVWHLTKRDEQP